MGAELESKVTKATTAFYTNREQLCYKGVDVRVRLSLLYKLVGQVLLYGCETVTLSDAYCERLD
eukprot:10049203-Karenia_brevis.AAC.1